MVHLWIWQRVSRISSDHPDPGVQIPEVSWPQSVLTVSLEPLLHIHVMWFSFWTIFGCVGQSSIWPSRRGIHSTQWWTSSHVDLSSVPVYVGVVVHQPGVSKDDSHPAYTGYMKQAIGSITVDILRVFWRSFHPPFWSSKLSQNGQKQLRTVNTPL